MGKTDVADPQGNGHRQTVKKGGRGRDLFDPGVACRMAIPFFGHFLINRVGFIQQVDSKRVLRELAVCGQAFTALVNSKTTADSV